MSVVISGVILKVFWGKHFFQWMDSFKKQRLKPAYFICTPFFFSFSCYCTRDTWYIFFVKNQAIHKPTEHFLLWPELTSITTFTSPFSFSSTNWRSSMRLTTFYKHKWDMYVIHYTYLFLYLHVSNICPCPCILDNLSTTESIDTRS